MNKKIRIDLDLVIILIWIIITIIFIISPILNTAFIRTLLGIPIILFIPGYVLISTLFPKKDDLETIERIALSFGLSIAIVPLIGLLLNFTFGIRLIPILASLSIFILINIFLAIKRRNELSLDQRFIVSLGPIFEAISSEIRQQNKTNKILTIILIISIIGSFIYVIIVPKTGEKFTEFYILGKNGKADEYPAILKINESENITVGIVNHEYSTINYTVKTALDNSILVTEELTLYNNQTWEKNITFVPDKKGTDLKLEFLLFKENNFTISYRDLHLWVNITGEK